MAESLASEVQCPICMKNFTSVEIEEHANRCLFLNSAQSLSSQKRKSQSRDQLGSTTGSSTNYTPNNKKSRICPESTENQREIIAKNSVENESSSSAARSVPDIKSSSLSIDKNVPLAEQVRPLDLTSFVGQEKILGSSSALRRLLEKGDVTSMILWGPPGCGKTTLASIIANNCRSGKTLARFVKMSAVSSGVGDVKEVVKAAKNEQVAFKRRTILFMDEIHRFNKLQQDIFLPHVESGCIILVGATTENPSFSLNSALLSRCRVFVLEKLSSEQILQILSAALARLGAVALEESKCDTDRSELLIESEAVQWLAETCDGDARIALNSLQLAFQSHQNPEGSSRRLAVTVDDVRESIKRTHLLYDRAGEEHYNLISAMHKSIRASDQNAALYWLTRMIQSGEDPRFIARRLVRAASEDIGLADSSALPLAVATMQGCQLLGMPEADVLLAQCAVYLARAPKSREVDTALAKAKMQIAQHPGALPSVPLHLRNAPTRLMEELGYAKGYSMNPSEVPDMIYMPEGLEDVNFFTP